VSDEPAEEGEPAAGDEAAAEPAPKPVRRKRRKKRPAPAAEPAPEIAAEPAPDRPAFAHDFPRDPELDALVAAFEQGDYARVRREAPELVHRTESDEVRRAARLLRRRLDPDPLATYLFAAAAALLVFLAIWYWTHPHEAPPP
jgi:hypothetical protein